MMTSSNQTIFCVTALGDGDSPVTSEFPSQRPVTQSFDVFFHLCLNKRLRKQYMLTSYEVIIMAIDPLQISKNINLYEKVSCIV